MPQLTYPGVYIEELPSGVHTITGVATSIAAFVGWADQGSTTEAVLVQSWMDFVREFGGLDSRSLLGYSVSQFFNNGGQQAYIIRLVSAAIKSGATGTAPTAATGIASLPTTDSSALAVNFTALGPILGAAGNSYGVQTTLNTDGTISVAVVYAPSGSALVASETFPNIAAANLVSTLTGSSGSKLVGATLTGDPTKFAKPSAATVILCILSGGADGNGLNVPGATPASVTINSPKGATGLGFTFTAQNPGAWGNLLAIGTTAQAGDATNTRFSLNVVSLQSDGSLSVVESYNNLSVSPGDPQYVVTVINADSSFVTAAAAAGGPAAQALNSPFPSTSAATGPFSSPPFLKGGFDGIVLDPTLDGANGGLFMTALNSDGSGGTGGVHLLDNVDIFNLLCVPGETEAVVIQNLQGYCHSQRAFYIVDGLGSATLPGLKAQTPASMMTSGPAGNDAGSITGQFSINSAYYYPWVQAPDPLSGNRPRYFPPCGFVAGIYAATDADRGVWKAPAGIDASLTGVSGLQYVLTDLQNGTLNVQAVNCVRQFRVYGDVVWGARTLQGNDQAGSQWKYVPIRRLALFLETSLFDGTQWVVFELNDETLWGQIRLNVGSFMQGLFLQGAFQGTTPQQAYFVKCDSENNPQSSIDLGIVNVLVGFAPLFPAEFVVIQIQQLAGQSQS